MKKILTVLFCLSLTVLAGSLTACHIHVFREWEVVEFANPGVKGEETRSCRCGYTETRETDPIPGSVGLIYILNEDGESYMVSGVGSCTDTELVIPATYNGKPVTTIGEWAFCNCTNLTSVIIPDSVTSIGDGAFERCTSLTSVVIPDGVTSIGKYALYNCTSLTSVAIGNSVTSIGGVFSNCPSLTSITVNENNTAYQSIDGNLYTKDGKTLVQYAVGKMDPSFTIPSHVIFIGNSAFCFCESLMSVVIPDSVTSIGNYAFEMCTSLMSVVIPNGVTSIGNCAFEVCTSLTSVVIPDSVTSIGYLAFCDCSNLTSVYYGGTESDWTNISIGYFNTDLTFSAHRYYYSETQPTEEGNYWHYDEEGNPVGWE